MNERGDFVGLNPLLSSKRQRKTNDDRPNGVSFHEGHNRVSKRNAAENLALLRRLTLSLLQAHPAKLSIAKKRFAAALDPDFLEEILRGDGILEKR